MSEERDTGNAPLILIVIIGLWAVWGKKIVKFLTILKEVFVSMVTAIIDFIPTLLKWVGIGLLGCLVLYGVVSVWLFFDKLFEKVKALEESLERFKSRADQRIRVLENDNEFLTKKVSYLSNELDGVKSHTGFSAKQEVEEAANDIIKWA